MQRPWNWPGGEECPGAERLAERYGMPRPVAVTLARRGMVEDSRVDEYLNPRLRRLADPRGLTGIEPAVARLWRAVDAGETIFIHGDYDVDGIAGTAFLARTLRALGGRVVPFVPSREEGYGLGEIGIGVARDSGARVLITVDTGIRAHPEIERAQSLGLDVIVLDHHEPSESLPPAHAVVNPLCGEGGEGFRNLAAVGVAAKFVHALAAERPGDEIRRAYREALQLVALGTIADVVPLTGENRILVRHGLAQLSGSGWAGIKALLAIAGMRRRRISAGDVAFFLAPRLNAAGRMGDARDALRLLLEDDPAEAYRLASVIESLNQERKKAEREVVDEAAARLRVREELPPALVLWSDEWPVGVVGIAASRLADRYHRPVFLIAVEGDRGRGSARSRSGMHLPRTLAACDDLLADHGGHAQAAGFEIDRGHLEEFRDRIEALGRAEAAAGEPDPWEVDAAVILDEVNPDCVQWLDRLSPFGRGNPEPLFGARSLELADDPSVVGDRHLRLTFDRGGDRLRAIAFNQGEKAADLSRGRRVDAVFHATFDTWRGGQHVQLVVRDLIAR